MKQTAFEKIEVGASLTRRDSIDEKSMKQYAEWSGDFNPIHFDPTFAATTRFTQPIVHGLLYICKGSRAFFDLCGYGYVLLSFSSQYLQPVYINQEVVTTLTVTKRMEDKKILYLGMTAETSSGVVSRGELQVKYIGVSDET